jgi:membrane protein implicated in regulation of membrane protease activity
MAHGTWQQTGGGGGGLEVVAVIVGAVVLLAVGAHALAGAAAAVSALMMIVLWTVIGILAAAALGISGWVAWRLTHRRPRPAPWQQRPEVQAQQVHQITTVPQRPAIGGLHDDDVHRVVDELLRRMYTHR